MKKIILFIVYLIIANFSFGQLNKSLMYQLDTIHKDDQKYRIEIEVLIKKFGWESNEIHSLIKAMNETDSANLIKVEAILDNYGWLGNEIIGNKGNSTLFLVLQHADQLTQEKYLPMMREAVLNGKAKASNLALMEDRILLRQGKKQIYGTQIGMDNQTKLYYVSPLEDPKNVDKRRASMGLEPLAEYVKEWQIVWDLKKYKKDLPKYIELENRIIK